MSREFYCKICRITIRCDIQVTECSLCGAEYPDIVEVKIVPCDKMEFARGLKSSWKMKVAYISKQRVGNHTIRYIHLNSGVIIETRIRERRGS